MVVDISCHFRHRCCLILQRASWSDVVVIELEDHFAQLAAAEAVVCLEGSLSTTGADVAREVAESHQLGEEAKVDAEDQVVDVV